MNQNDKILKLVKCELFLNRLDNESVIKVPRWVYN